MASPDLTISRRNNFDRPTAKKISQLGKVPTSMIGDSLGRRCGLGPKIQAMTESISFAGPALTIRCRGGDNLAALVALDSIRPGDVIVIACGGNTEAAVVGGNYAAMAKTRGAVAIITDGLIRDVNELDAMKIAVYGAGVTTNGPFKTGPGEIGLPVALGDVTIAPGDVLIGDRDGVVAIPQHRLDEALERSAAVQAREADMSKSHAMGKVPTWLEQLIAAVPVRDLD